VIGGVGSSAGRVAPLIGGDSSVPGCYEGRELIPPTVSGLGEPMEQHDQLAVDRPFDPGIKGQTIADLDRLHPVIVIRVTRTRQRTTAVTGATEGAWTRRVS
jgi:hypothetical protein